MKIGLIDNDLCTRKKSAFPNLALMKLSAYHKNIGDDVQLINITEFDNVLFTPDYDKVYCAKVFSDTPTPEYIYNKNIELGGSGFFYENAKKLPLEIEHIMPDYNLYNKNVIKKYVNKTREYYFTDFSIGFTTRGCIRRCPFCINKNEKSVYKHSDLNEFIDNDRPYIMLLDDNIIAYDQFEKTFEQLNKTGKPFVYKQGMDFRLLDKRKMDIIFNSNYFASGKVKTKGSRTFHFAFDNYSDKTKIEYNLNIYYSNKQYSFKVFFYVLTGYSRSGVYDVNFFNKDFYELLKRIELLFKYSAYPYIMMHENYKLSPLNKYIHSIKRLCNTPMFITNKTMRKALELSNEHELIEYLKTNYSWFLDLQFNSKMLKI